MALGAAAQGKVVRQYARATALAPATTAAIPAVQPPAPKEFSVLADPGDVRASRMAKDFAAVMSVSGAPGHAIVGPTSPDGLGKVLKTDLADFAVVSLDSLVSGARATLNGSSGFPMSRASRLRPWR